MTNPSQRPAKANPKCEVCGNRSTRSTCDRGCEVIVYRPKRRRAR